MSADEDTELRDLVSQTLETNGVLGKLRAQLRASVFLALEENESVQNKSPMSNTKLKKFMGTQDGTLVVLLIKDFLEFFDLEYTSQVFEAECGYQDCVDRDALARDLNIVESVETDVLPLVSEVVKRSCGGKPTRSNRPEEGGGVPKDLSPQHLAEAREKFETYDTDCNGTIEKDELRQLFSDMFPNFHRNMLDRYVNDEFKAADKDFSNAIDFEEFLDMYRRLFVLCRSVVSNDVSDVIVSPRRAPTSPTALSHTSKIPAPLVLKKGHVADVNSSNSSRRSDIPEKERNGARSPLGAADGHDWSQTSPKDDDSFFDEPMPNNDRNNKFSKQQNGPVSPTSPRPSQIPRFNSAKNLSSNTSSKSTARSGMSSLSNLPSLTAKSNPASTNRANDVGDVRDIDQQLTNLGVDVPDDDYDDEDFESSNISPRNPMPKSARSDHNVKSIEEDIDEEIDEDLSDGADLLKSEDDGMDDLTTDRTVSPTEQSTAFDYAEDVQLP